MEELLYHVWRHRLYSNPELHCVDGTPIEILSPGVHNKDSGPDFFNAKIRVDSTVWVGNVEIHDYASQWYQHNHHTDKAYDSVILHVVHHSDTTIQRSNGQDIPQFELLISPSITTDYQSLRNHSSDEYPCFAVTSQLSPLLLSDFIDGLGMERLQSKADTYLDMLKRYKGDWEEVFYIILARSIGTGINSDAFERLARSIPRSTWLKHSNSLLQIESMFFGQAGFLSSETIEHSYYIMLRREYAFLSHKFHLDPLPSVIWRSFRTRPSAFPQIRIAYLCALLYDHPRLFEECMNAQTTGQILDLLNVAHSSFWDDHYHFAYASKKGSKRIGRTTLNSILINAYVPMLYAYAIYNGNVGLTEKAISILESLPPEDNVYVRHCRNAGIPVRNAFDSQAVIQLHREYCQRDKCIYCRMGHQFLTRSH